MKPLAIVCNESAITFVIGDYRTEGRFESARQRLTRRRSVCARTLDSHGTLSGPS